MTAPQRRVKIGTSPGSAWGKVQRTSCRAKKAASGLVGFSMISAAASMNCSRARVGAYCFARLLVRGKSPTLVRSLSRRRFMVSGSRVRVGLGVAVFFAPSVLLRSGAEGFN